MLKGLVLSIGGIVLLVLVALVVWCVTLPPLPDSTQQIIDEQSSLPLAEFVTGDTAYAQSGDIRIWYEHKRPNLRENQAQKGTVLLINGMGSSAIFWPPLIINRLLAAGYSVIVSDHRGCGESSRIDNWTSDTAYTLSDMVSDNLAVLDAEGIKRAHVLGLSLGGMVAQEMAISKPERVNSLISVMSTGFANDPEIPVATSFRLDVFRLFLRYGLIRSESNLVKLIVATYDLLKGDSDIDVTFLVQASLYELRQRQGFNHELPTQQVAAVNQSGSRLQALSTVTAPSLVIHGQLDPLLDIAHAKKYAAQIPGADTLWVSGMGHAAEPAATEVWMEKVITFLEGAGSRE